MKAPGNKGRGRQRKTSPPKSASKQKKQRKPAQTEKDQLEEYDSEKGLEYQQTRDKKGKKIQIRRSKRLSNVRQQMESSSDEQSDPEPPKKRQNKRKRSTKDTNNNDQSPPKYVLFYINHHLRNIKISIFPNFSVLFLYIINVNIINKKEKKREKRIM